MKKLAVLLFFFISIKPGLSKDPESRVFLVLFKATELKYNNTTLKSIESQFSSFFSTKTYDGNSEIALLIDIPSCDFDACFLGEFLINLEDGRKTQLQQLAFRVFDLSENISLHQSYLTMYEESQALKKKSSKTIKAASLP
jgi:hypothetical protein